MTKNNAIVATFSDHTRAEDAVRKLAQGGLDIKHFSIIGKGYHKDEQVLGFYNAGDRMLSWGGTGAFWGGLWGVFFGGIMLTVPVAGPVIVLGNLAAVVFGALEGAVLFGGLGALGGALSSLGIPKDSIIQYVETLKSDGFLIIAHGPTDEMARAKSILDTMTPTQLDVHQNTGEMTALPTHSEAHERAS